MYKGSVILLDSLPIHLTAMQIISQVCTGRKENSHENNLLFDLQIHFAWICLVLRRSLQYAH